ncbi:Uncharacterised protein [uncultured archaeon]|nr:Uncharacterised protein [uncultured archaeon]
MRNSIQHAFQGGESGAFILEIGGELQQHAAQEARLGQGLHAGPLKRGGPKDRPLQITLHEGLVGDQLGDFD